MSPHTGRAMGTTFVIVLHPGDVELAEGAIEHLHDLERRWSRFLANSEISVLNRSPGVAVIVSPDTFHVVRAAVDAAAATHGRFDPTVYDTMHAIGYDRTFEEIEPNTHPLAPPHASPGPAGIEFDESLHAITLPVGVRLDLGGIGKGTAADLVTGRLRERGARGAAVSIGGDLRVRGESPTGEGWTVVYNDRPLEMAPLIDGGVCTSTVTRRRWATDRGNVHHLVDPRTGRPTPSGIESITVVGATAQQAEVLTKTAMVAGAAAPAVLERYGVTSFVRWSAAA